MIILGTSMVFIKEDRTNIYVRYNPGVYSHHATALNWFLKNRIGHHDRFHKL